MTPEQACQISDPLERQWIALAEMEAAREAWKQAAGTWSAIRAGAVLQLKAGRTWAEVAELLGVSEPTAWNIAHPKSG
jgi:predicted transcriptional regulator